MKKISRLTSLILLCTSLLLSVFFCNISASAFIPGDVTGDGRVSSEDSRAILRLSVGIDTITEEILKRADIDRDGSVSANDARLALRCAIGLNNISDLIPGSEIIGYSNNGYAIYTANGLTYIDGVLIVNKTYSLPESYNPDGILPECENAFNAMKKDAAALGLNIYISSGFRSFASQKSIYNRYVARDGRYLADTYSARPGHSEHQTGLSIDLNTITQAFGRTREGKWVAEHCHEYGFIIRYPEGKSDITGYCYEPWHLRYVGTEAAAKIKASGLCLEEYYGITSSYQ